MGLDLGQLGARLMDRAGPKSTIRRVSNGLQRLSVPDSIAVRRCAACNEDKPLSAFDPDRRFKDARLKKICNFCLAENRRRACREYHRKHQPRFTAYMREYNQRRGYLDIKEWRNKNRTRYNEYQRSYRKRKPVAKEAERRYRENWKAKNPTYSRDYYLRNRDSMMLKQKARREQTKMARRGVAA